MGPIGIQIMKISYSTVEQFQGWELAREAFGILIQKIEAKNVLEIGSGANPTLPVDFVHKHGISYTTNDIDANELSKADPTYTRLCHDFSELETPVELREQFDLVFSRMVNEHVRDGERYYRNIHSVLKPNGITVHCFSTLYALPFVANRLIPEKASELLLNFFAPRDRIHQAKFKAYYSWGSGPTQSMLKNFSRLGFEVMDYAGYFGHKYYKSRLPLVHNLEMKKAAWLVRHPIPQLTSYAKVVLRKI